MKAKKANSILRKYLDNAASDEERAIVESWYNEKAKGQESNPLMIDRKALKTAMWEQIDAHNRALRRQWQRWAVGTAAAFLMVFVTFFYFDDRPAINQALLVPRNIVPGGNKASLMLPGGKVIDLSETQNGIVIKSGNVSYADGSEIIATPVVDLPSVEWFTLSTPKGGQYQIVLPDSSKVWLNAASILRYPMAFSADERLVQLSGEGYFEVAKGSTPFRVATDSQVVEVLGTQFNISGYEDDQEVKTTLIEGRVKVVATLSGLQQSKMLAPGQQSILMGDRMDIVYADAESAVAWKNGYFIFDDEPLEGIMQKIARWYDVDIIYQEGVDRQRLFGGSVSKYDRVSSVLEKLELTGGVHFEITERGIVVMK